MVATWFSESLNPAEWGMNKLVSFYRTSFRLVSMEKTPPSVLERVVHELASRGDSSIRASFHEYLVSTAYSRPKGPMTLEERDTHRIKEIIDHQAAEYFFRHVVG